MQIVLRTIKLSRAKKREVESTPLEVEVLTIGRGTDNRLQLTGLMVPMRHSRIRRGAGGVLIERVDSERLQVNGRMVTDAVLSPGDVVDVGTHAVRVLPVEHDEDLLLEVEEVRTPGAAGGALFDRSRLGVEGGLFSRRPLSWLGLLLVLGACLVVPLRTEQRTADPNTLPDGDANRLLHTWSTGPLTRAHARLGTHCGACHRDAFARVADDACLACHPAVGSHATATRTTADLGGKTCTACHLEHRGEAHLIDPAATDCTGCHADPGRIGAPPQIGLVTAFDAAAAHPEFSIALPDGVGPCRRIPVAPPASGPTKADPLIERGGLRFSHRVHLAPDLPDHWDKDRARRTTKLECPACHRLDPTGRFMAPVTFDSHCKACHELTFTERDQSREVVHPARPDVVRQQALEFFARAALGDDAPEAPRQRRRPGRPLTDAERATTMARAQRDAEHALDDLLGTAPDGRPSGVCAVCHLFTVGGDVQAVQLGGTTARCRADRADPDPSRPYAATQAGRWMPRALFSHADHFSRSDDADAEAATAHCKTCHDVEAAGAPTGMLPAKAACLPCHARDATRHATRDLADCSVCHRFHQPQQDSIKRRRDAATSPAGG